MFNSRYFIIHLFAALAVAFTLAHLATAQVYLTIDGRDVANLAGDGNHATFHNPPVNFVFTFGGVAGDNPDAGPGDPPTATETNFNLPEATSADWDLAPPPQATSHFRRLRFSRWTSPSIEAIRSPT